MGETKQFCSTSLHCLSSDAGVTMSAGMVTSLMTMLTLNRDDIGRTEALTREPAERLPQPVETDFNYYSGSPTPYWHPHPSPHWPLMFVDAPEHDFEDASGIAAGGRTVSEPTPPRSMELDISAGRFKKMALKAVKRALSPIKRKAPSISTGSQ